MLEEMSTKEIKIGYPGTNPFDPGPGKEALKKYEDIAEENIKDFQEIKNSHLDKVPEKIQNKAARVVKNVLKGGTLGGITIMEALSLFGCKGTPAIEQPAEEEKGQETVPSETTPQETKEETKLVEEKIVEEVNVPEIPGLTFNQETKSYFNEAGVEVGVYVEDAVKINREMTSVIALKPEAINEILEENRQKGIFKCPWPFDWQKDKDMEIVELFWTSSYQQETYEKHGIYIPNFIAIKFTKPINFYTPFDVNDEIPGNVNEVFPDKKEDPNFTSAQGYKNLVLTSVFNYESEETEGKYYASIQFNFIDWQPLVALGESYELGNEGYGQDILGEIKAGTLLGKILPNKPDFDFLDFSNNPEFQKNPGQFQGNLIVFDFQDDFSKPTSSLEKMLKYKNKAGQEIPVCIWSKENTVHEQTN